MENSASYKRPSDLNTVLAHGTTAWLSYHTQNFVVISLLEWEWIKFPSKLNGDGNVVSEMGPWINYD